MIYPGETKTLSFTLPFKAAYLKKVYASFKQMDMTVLTVEVDDVNDLTSNVPGVENSNNTCVANVKLTQKQSLQIRDYVGCMIQFNVITADGLRISSNPIYVKIGEQFNRNDI